MTKLEKEAIMAESAIGFLLRRLAPVFENEVTLFTGVREEVVYLKGQLESIRAFLRVADALEESDEELKVCVKQARDVAHDAEDLLDELELVQAYNRTDGFSVSLRGFSRQIRNMKTRYRIASELKGINSRMSTIFSIHKRILTKFDTASHASSSTNAGTVTNFHEVFRLKSSLLRFTFLTNQKKQNHRDGSADIS